MGLGAVATLATVWDGCVYWVEAQRHGGDGTSCGWCHHNNRVVAVGGMTTLSRPKDENLVIVVRSSLLLLHADRIALATRSACSWRVAVGSW